MTEHDAAIIKIIEQADAAHKTDGRPFPVRILNGLREHYAIVPLAEYQALAAADQLAIELANDPAEQSENVRKAFRNWAAKVCAADAGKGNHA